MKRSRQLPEHSAVGKELAHTVLAVLAIHPTFFVAALPARTRSSCRPSDETVVLTGHYHNLLRLWAET